MFHLPSGQQLAVSACLVLLSRSAVSLTLTPFPSHVLPASTMADPISKFISRIYPLPYNPPSLVQADGSNNFHHGSQANNDFCPSLVNRYDWVATGGQGLSGKRHCQHREATQTVLWKYLLA